MGQFAPQKEQVSGGVWREIHRYREGEAKYNSSRRKHGKRRSKQPLNTQNTKNAQKEQPDTIALAESTENAETNSH